MAAPSIFKSDSIFALLKEAFDQVPEKIIEIKRLDEGGAGYMSYILSVHVTWKNAVNLPERLILKLPTIDKIVKTVQKSSDGIEESQLPDHDSFMKTLTSTHAHECRFYQLVNSVDSESATPARLLSNVKIPKCYYIEDIDSLSGKKGALVMQDFSQTAKTLSFVDGPNLDQILALVQNLAALHAYSIACPGWEKIIKSVNPDVFEDFMPFLRNSVTATHQDYPDIFPYTLEQVEHILVDNIWSIEMPSKFAKVIVQGDFWSNNLLFHENGQLAAIIDWQGCHPGSPCEDIARLLSSCVNPELRHEKLNQIINHYHQSLNDYLAEFNIAERYSRADIHELYEDAFKIVAPFMIAQTYMMLKVEYSGITEEQKRLCIRRMSENVKDALAIYAKS